MKYQITIALEKPEEVYMAHIVDLETKALRTVVHKDLFEAFMKVHQEIESHEQSKIWLSKE